MLILEARAADTNFIPKDKPQGRQVAIELFPSPATYQTVTTLHCYLTINMKYEAIFMFALGSSLALAAPLSEGVEELKPLLQPDDNACGNDASAVDPIHYLSCERRTFEEH